MRRGDDKHVDEDSWVLGDQRKQKKVDVAAVQSAYFHRYIDVWKNFFLSLTIKEPTTLPAASGRHPRWTKQRTPYM